MAKKLTKVKTCTCIGDFEMKVKERGFDGKKVESAKFISSGFMMPDLHRQASGEVKIQFEGAKKEKTINVMYSFCPFCGEKYPEKS